MITFLGASTDFFHMLSPSLRLWRRVSVNLAPRPCTPQSHLISKRFGLRSLNSFEQQTYSFALSIGDSIRTASNPSISSANLDVFSGRFLEYAEKLNIQVHNGDLKAVF